MGGLDNRTRFLEYMGALAIPVEVPESFADALQNDCGV